MATLTEEQLKLVRANIKIEDRIEFDQVYYGELNRLTGYYNNQDYSIDNEAIKLDMSLNIKYPESFTPRIDIHLKDMWIGDDEFELTDFKQQQILKEEIKKEISKDLYI